MLSIKLIKSKIMLSIVKKDGSHILCSDKIKVSIR